MSYLLSRLDLVVNNATNQITVNTNPSTQSYINGDITPSDNIFDIPSTNNRFSNPDDLPAATILSVNKATTLTNLTATDTGIFNIPVSSEVAGNGLNNTFTSYYDGITYSPELLTCVGVNDTSTTIGDLSNNNFTITNNGAVTVSNLAPFSSSRAYSSLNFNGTTQYLSTVGTTGGPLDLAAGAGNWTVECWFYLNNVSTAQSIFWKGGTTTTINPSYSLALANTTGQWIVGNGAAAGATQNLSTVFAANTWYHFALVRSGNILTAYVNGVAETPVTMSFTMSNTSNNTLTIGSSVADGSTRFLAGNISNFRVVKGTAVYIGNFMPMPGNFSPVLVSTSKTKVSSTTYTKLTYLPLDIKLYNNLMYNATTGQTEIYDKTLTINSYNAATSNINVVSSTKIMNVKDVPDFYITGSDAPNILGSYTITNTSSLGGSFNGTSSNITITAADAGPLDLATSGSWTVECWFYATSITGSRSIFWKGGGGGPNPSYAFWLNGATPQWIMGDGSTGGVVINLSDIAINTWYHFALVRNGDTVTSYVNGIGSTPSTISFTMQPTTSSTLWIGAAVDGRYFSGYISGFRVFKGIALYTGNFAILPQISLLLATPYNANFFKDSSSYSLSVTNTGSTSSNIAPTWSSGTSGSSKFLGSSYLSIPGPNSSVIDLATGAPNWTIECWFRKDDITTDGAIFWKDGTSGSINPSYGLWIQGGVAVEGQPQWIVGNGGGGGAFQNMSTSIVANTWYHFALVRSGLTLTAYLNGVADTPVSIGFTMSQQGANLTIGAAVDPSLRYGFGGYISNFRIVKGSALYTSNFTVPTSPFTLPTLPTATIDSTINSITGTQTSLLLSTTNDGNYLKDSSVNNFTVTNNDGVTSTSTGPTWSSGSTSSLSFNGTNSYLNIPGNSAFDFGSDDFTVECYFYLRSIQGNNPQYLIHLYSGSSACLGIYAKPGNIYGAILTDAGTQATYSSANNVVTLNNWYHVAYVRNGTNHYLYLNGQQAAYKVFPVSPIFAASTALNIGTYGSPVSRIYYVDGYISNIRMIKGKALYTNSFIVPNMPLTTTQSASTSAYPASLLTLKNTNIIDNSAFANPITSSGVSTTLPYSSFLNSFTASVPGGTVSTPGNPAYIKNTTIYNDPTQVGGYFNSFIPDHTGEEDRVQKWV